MMHVNVKVEALMGLPLRRSRRTHLRYFVTHLIASSACFVFPLSLHHHAIQTGEEDGAKGIIVFVAAGQVHCKKLS